MKYDFDTIIPRRGTNSYKWDTPEEENVLPMWVADMDFRTPPFVMEALRKRLEHEVLGYTSACEDGILPFVAGSVVATVGTSLARC